MIMSLAQLAVERVLNSLPEGLLIALGAWLLLRLMGRQNSGTRFAVWLVALTGVVALPFLSGLGSLQHGLPLMERTHSEITISTFWASAFFILWIAIALAALARVAAGVWQVRKIRRSCTEIVAADLDPELRELIIDTGRPVRLLTSEKVRVPAALGFRYPAIVLPAWALRDFDAEALRPILIHELAHLRRRDDWTNLLQKAVRAILFFHPAVWWIDARLSLEREMACDDAVLAATGNPRAYAGCLIDLLEKGCARRGWIMAQAAVSRARDASVRIARILRVGPIASTRVGPAALGVAATLALTCAGVALYSPQLVEFVPIDSTSAQIARPLSARSILDGGVGIPAGAVIPASFHPAQKSALHRDIPMRRTVAPHRAALRHVAVLKAPAQKEPVVMAKSLIPAANDQAGPIPMLVIFETTESEINTADTAQLRAVSERRVIGNKQQLQSREDPGLRIEMIQGVDPATGLPVQILRIVLVVPQQGGLPSQSI
ncbi:MAG TPA: M56 family metallopeptidase [Acidobacteriaceae bacterium]|jgi:beta-lactamase regulating signal transducer with metallopeptidase domain